MTGRGSKPFHKNYVCDWMIYSIIKLSYEGKFQYHSHTASQIHMAVMVRAGANETCFTNWIN